MSETAGNEFAGMWQDADRTIPATGYNQPVGHIEARGLPFAQPDESRRPVVRGDDRPCSNPECFAHDGGACAKGERDRRECECWQRGQRGLSDEEWRRLGARMGGYPSTVKMLARNCALVRYDGARMVLALPTGYAGRFDAYDQELLRAGILAGLALVRGDVVDLQLEIRTPRPQAIPCADPADLSAEIDAEQFSADRKCVNCAEWQGFDGGTLPRECAESGELTRHGDSCNKFRYDPSRFCAICGGVSLETEHSGMVCANNDAHFASQWDYEWHDFTKLGNDGPFDGGRS